MEDFYYGLETAVDYLYMNAAEEIFIKKQRNDSRPLFLLVSSIISYKILSLKADHAEGRVCLKISALSGMANSDARYFK
ncbi:MAG: hypothetical protein ACLTS6_16810 [Anaerobutyricum sp.]